MDLSIMVMKDFVSTESFYRYVRGYIDWHLCTVTGGRGP